MTTLYETSYYLMVGKTKLCYGMNLNFYDLVDSDLDKLISYLGETVRYRGKWFVVKSKTARFRDKKTMQAFPENWIKLPYKKAVSVKDFLEV